MSKIEIDTDKIQPLVNMLYLSNEPKVYKLANYIKTDKNQAEFAYGIMGTQDADCDSNKDTAFWNASIRLDVYSNYKGKKVITKTLEALLNYFCSEGYDKLQEVFYAEGFVMTSLSVGSLVVNAPMYSDIGVWQSGGTRLTFKLTQMKEE